MLSVKDLKSLEVGDLVSADPLFKGLAEEPLTLMVELVDTATVEFKATWHGVHLGIWVASVDGNSVTWFTGFKK